MKFGIRILFALFSLAFLVCFAVPAYAGNIYGSLWIDGKPAPGAQIQIRCTVLHPAQTDGNGSYGVFVAENARCVFHVDFQGRSGEIPVASYGNPIKYDFDLVPEGDRNFVLRSR